MLTNARHIGLIATLAATIACGEEGTGDSGSNDASTNELDAGTAANDSGTTTDSGTTMANGCGARALIAFYQDANCTPGTEVGMRSYDTAQTCFSWTAQGSNAMDNSATRFQCYRDRVCYTQHAGTLTCENGSHGQTDKEARIDACVKEPAGVLYSKLLSGTENCPEAPAGFECPSSAAEQGTAGIVACGG